MKTAVRVGAREVPVYFTIAPDADAMAKLDAIAESAIRRAEVDALRVHLASCVRIATTDLVGRHNTAEMRACVVASVRGEILRSADRGEMARWGVHVAEDVAMMGAVAQLEADGRVGVRLDMAGTVLAGVW